MTAPIETKHRRRQVRIFAAAMAATIAVLYMLIGFSLVRVVKLAAGEPSPQLFFGLPAALAFVFGAALLLATDHRWLWILGALLQVLVMFTYFSVAPQRVPSFETWGVLIRVVQVPLLVALGYLAVTWPEPTRRSGGVPLTA
jgi:hypothetical protein